MVIALVLRLLCYFNKVFGIVKSVMCYNNKKDLQLDKISGRYSHHLLMSCNWEQLSFFTDCIYRELGFSTFVLLSLQLEPRLSTMVPLYSLKMGRDYEIRVRSRQRTSEKFGEFSEILYVTFSQTGVEFCSKVGTVYLFAKEARRLKMLIFPPVPVPKIKGIDPDLLKKGKLDEVNSILASHDSYKTHLYNDDLWVEFIELDIEDPEEKNRVSDTDRLLNEDHLKSQCCLGAKDDDSGRASCCEPDIPETDFSASDTCDAISDIDQFKKVTEKEEDLLCLDRKDNGESFQSLADTDTQQPHTNTQSKNSQLWPPFADSIDSARPSIHTQLSNQNSLTDTDFYTQVSNITPEGSVVLSPGQKSKVGRAQCESCTEQNFTMDNAYFCEEDVKKCIAVTSHEEDELHIQEQSYEDAYFTTESLTTTAVNLGASTAETPSSEMPVLDYTSINIIHSLVLNATALPVPDKEFNMSCGYVSTDQLNKIML
uniref:Growth hormone-binding protein domain-containing protein n=1 Tax=Accipiter nisus TaxID=211598 RepID=A0A8B9NIV1_9AVES